MSKDDGGPAFPATVGSNGEPIQIGNNTWQESGMSLRDYFAAHCPQEEVEERLPSTVGDMRDALIARGLIPKDRMECNVIKSYGETDVEFLRARIRYEYADAMLAERSK